MKVRGQHFEEEMLPIGIIQHTQQRCYQIPMGVSVNSRKRESIHRSPGDSQFWVIQTYVSMRVTWLWHKSNFYKSTIASRSNLVDSPGNAYIHTVRTQHQRFCCCWKCVVISNLILEIKRLQQFSESEET